MISVTDLRNGTTFEENKEIFEVLTYEHIKMGRGSANIKIKARNIRTGSTIEKSFMNGAQVADIAVDKRELQFLYKDQETAFFMDANSFEQFTFPLKRLSGHEYLEEGENATIRFYNDEALGLVLPPKVTLTVEETAPGVKGNTASNVYKDSTLSNGMKVRVPLFISEGDKVVVDTRDGSYTKRA